MDSMDVVAATAFICLTIFGTGLLIESAINRETNALYEIAANSKPPVAIRLDGFSPEAQAVFNAAVRPKSNGKGNGK